MARKVIKGEVIHLDKLFESKKRRGFQVRTSDEDLWGDFETEFIWHDIKPYPHIPSCLKVGDKVEATVKRFGFATWELISIRTVD